MTDQDQGISESHFKKKKKEKKTLPSPPPPPPHSLPKGSVSAVTLDKLSSGSLQSCLNVFVWVVKTYALNWNVFIEGRRPSAEKCLNHICAACNGKLLEGDIFYSGLVNRGKWENEITKGMLLKKHFNAIFYILHSSNSNNVEQNIRTQSVGLDDEQSGVRSVGFYRWQCDLVHWQHAVYCWRQ